MPKSDVVKYPLAGYKALSDYANAMNDTALQADLKAKEAKMMEVAKAAEAATKDAEHVDDPVAALVWYSAFSDGYSAATDKAALGAERLRMLQAVMATMENFDLHIETVDAAIEQKNADVAIQNLMAAVKANVTYDTTGDQHFRTINDKMAQMKGLGMLPDAAAADLQKLQDAWRAAKADNDKAEKEFKAEQAKQKAERDPAKKKLDADNKKAMDEQKKSADATGTKK